MDAILRNHPRHRSQKSVYKIHITPDPLMVTSSRYCILTTNWDIIYGVDSYMNRRQ